MHMASGETFTRAQEVTKCFVSVGNRRCFDRFRPISTGIGPRLNRRWEHSRMGISEIN